MSSRISLITEYLSNERTTYCFGYSLMILRVGVLISGETFKF